jgi:hypothetical protein
MLAVLLMSALVFVAPARAELTSTDVQIAARALSFVSNPLTGPVRVGIVYSAESPRSVREANSLQHMLSGGLKIGALQMSPVMVELKDVAGADVDLFFLTEFLEPDALPRPSPGGPTPRVCITTDIEQVRNGGCTIGVRSRPKVQVFVSRSAAAASNIQFSTVFRVMITEI